MLKQSVKKFMLSAIIAAMAITAVSCCAAPPANVDDNTSSAIEATEGTDPEAVKTAVGENATEKATEKPTEKAKTKEEKAIEEKGLKVDDKGNVTDENGNKVKVDENGNVEVKTDDGQTVKVSTQEIKDTNNNSNTGTTTKPSSGSNNSTTSKPSSGSNSNTTSKPSSDSNSNTTSKPSSGNNNSTPSKPTPAPKPAPTEKPTEKPTTPKPTEPKKTWHEAVYKDVNHPAETKQVWVVDQEAYTYEEPVYERQGRTICNVCGEDMTDNLNHEYQHLLNDEGSGYHVEWKNVQVGTKTITVPEEGHYETKIIKEAWTEKVLVKEAGYY